MTTSAEIAAGRRLPVSQGGSLPEPEPEPTTEPGEAEPVEPSEPAEGTGEEEKTEEEPGED